MRRKIISVVVNGVEGKAIVLDKVRNRKKCYETPRGVRYCWDAYEINTSLPRMMVPDQNEVILIVKVHRCAIEGGEEPLVSAREG